MGQLKRDPSGSAVTDYNDDELTEAELLVLEAQLVVDRQREVVQELQAKGDKTSEAIRLLLGFIEVLTMQEQNRDALRTSVPEKSD